MDVFVATLICFLTAGLAPALVRRAEKLTPALALVPLGLLVWVLLDLDAILGAGVTQTRSWIPGMDIALAFHLDGLALLFLCLILGIGAVVVWYAATYLHDHPKRPRFFLFLFLFMGAMVGLVGADDLLVLFVYWELTSISSYFLIGLDHETLKSRKSALQALLVTGLGGLMLLAGLILLGFITGSSTVQEAIAFGALREGPLVTAMFIFLLLGALTKSAQFPFHFWLPGAMVAPSPVSAYLHSATMVKAGIYLLLRLHPSLGELQLWTLILVPIGLITLLVGIVLALRNTDMKLVLAYTTVAALGTLTFLIGIGTAHALEGAIVFLAAHAFYKGTLFLITGSVEHGTGTRELPQLGGLRKAMPLTAFAGILAGLSFAGFPPTLGFIGKEIAFASILEMAAPWNWIVLVTSALGLLGFVIVGIQVGIRPYFGALPDGLHPHESPKPMVLGPAVLALLGVVGALVPGLLQGILDGALSAAYGSSKYVSLYLWHGFNAALVTSVLLLLLGIFLAGRGPALRRAMAGFGALDRIGPKATYERLLDATLRFAKQLARWMQPGSISGYLRITFLAGGLAAWAGLLRSDVLSGLQFNWAMPLIEWTVVAMILVGAIALTQVRNRWSGVIWLGLTGYGVAILFVLYSAPDLAITQLLFETLSVLIFVLVLLKMPDIEVRSSTSRRAMDGAIAATFALPIMLLLALAAGTLVDSPLREYFGESSYELAKGKNVVNVILVDFRGIDTLGEITVLAVATFGVLSLLRFKREVQDE